ncbi:MAG: ATP-dependent metallopeptidase FtsH/Yme1/Tma family protein, partial [Treponema sp.]|nr:ATP-dependent metallopeptidase FtsH/Yme1/Tma family protein [Treponema sp.]
MPDDKNNKSPLPPPRPPLQGGRSNRFALFFFLAIMGVFIAYFFRTQGTPPVQEISYSAFLNYLDQNEISAVKILDSGIIQGTIREAGGELRQFKTLIPYQDPSLLPTLRQRGINVSGGAGRISPLRILLEFLPWIIGFGFIWFMMRNMQGTGNKAFQFGKSRAKRYQDEGKKTTFADVAGQV